MAQLRCIPDLYYRSSLVPTQPLRSNLFPAPLAHLPLHPPSLFQPQIRSSCFPSESRRIERTRLTASFSQANPSSFSAVEDERFVGLEESGGGDNGAGSYNGGGGGGGWEGDSGEYGRERSENAGTGGLLGAFLRGWQARVKTDPQFPFKVLMEEVVGVGACVIGDMASRPNFGLNELDLVFSTIVVGSILNFTLMYMLAPTGSASSTLPGIFCACPPGHMFESGPYNLLDRVGTFVYKGTLFAAVGFAAGLVGTFTSTLLLNTRKKMDPSFVQQNKAPPTVLNAATWALHMGLSSNMRYQALNGLEFALARLLNPSAFKASVFVTRGLNNVLGGISFVTLARLTGSQKAEEEKPSPPSVGDQEALQPSQA